MYKDPSWLSTPMEPGQKKSMMEEQSMIFFKKTFHGVVVVRRVWKNGDDKLPIVIYSGIIS